HHTILVNRRTGGHQLWLDICWRLCLAIPLTNREFAASADVYEVPAHPVAFPALVAALIAPLRPTPEEVESDVALVMVMFCWLGVVAPYALARRAGFSRGFASLAAVVLACASPWLPYSRSYYAEPVIGVALALALLALEARWYVGAGLAA